MLRFAILMGLVLGACGDSGTSTPDAKPPTPDAPAGPTLTVKNFDVWCSVSVNGGAASTAAVQTVPISTPTDVTLVATPASSTFILGDWHHTDGDTGSGDPGKVSGTMSTAKVNVGTSNVCVWVCCPFANPPGSGCPTTDQCP